METPPAFAPPAPNYRDRSTGLTVFGVFEIILGCIVALMIPLTLLGWAMAARQQDGTLDPSAKASVLGTLFVFAVGLIWLGIGSIQAKRWARALLLCFGWMGLVFGTLSLVLVVASLGSKYVTMQQSGQESPVGALLIGKIIAVIVVVVMYVIIPGSLVLFYRSRHVKLTCEHRDPVERWTDRCPLPVIAWCIMQVYGAVSMLLMWRFSAAVPLFGWVVTGWIAHAAWLAFSGFCLWSAWGFYRLKYQTWLAYTILASVGGLSGLVTFSQVELVDYYGMLGLPERQIKQIAASPLAQGHNFIWFAALSFAVALGYLMFLQRYFIRTAPAETGGQSAA